jgi:hypothetical protein
MSANFCSWICADRIAQYMWLEFDEVPNVVDVKRTSVD